MTAPTTPPLLRLLDAHDRALFARFKLDGNRNQPGCRAWLVLTHLGGARCAILLTLLLLAMPGTGRSLFGRAAMSLFLSHLVVRIVKRRAERARPAIAMSREALVATPDQFSFPSGHACAAMSVAVTYGVFFPAIAPLLLLLAFFIGASRTALGVHYPGDVLVGQLIAVIVAVMAFA